MRPFTRPWRLLIVCLCVCQYNRRRGDTKSSSVTAKHSRMYSRINGRSRVRREIAEWWRELLEPYTGPTFFHSITLFGRFVTLKINKKDNKTKSMKNRVDESYMETSDRKEPFDAFERVSNWRSSLWRKSLRFGDTKCY